MSTQIRNIVAGERHFRVATNEDWIDGWPFEIAGSVNEDADLANAGNGTIGAVDLWPTTPLGLYRLVITDVENGTPFFAFSRRTTAGDQDLARGAVGLPVEANGMRFTLNQGATPFAIGDGFSLVVLQGLLDVTGIAFHLHLRRGLGAGIARPATPAVFASTQAGTLRNGGVAGVVNAAVSRDTMRIVEPRTYDYDLLAEADGLRRVVYNGTVEIVEGVTRLAA